MKAATNPLFAKKYLTLWWYCNITKKTPSPFGRTGYLSMDQGSSSNFRKFRGQISFTNTNPAYLKSRSWPTGGFSRGFSEIRSSSAHENKLPRDSRGCRCVLIFRQFAQARTRSSPRRLLRREPSAPSELLDKPSTKWINTLFLAEDNQEVFSKDPTERSQRSRRLFLTLTTVASSQRCNVSASHCFMRNCQCWIVPIHLTVYFRQLCKGIRKRTRERTTLCTLPCPLGDFAPAWKAVHAIWSFPDGSLWIVD